MAFQTRHYSWDWQLESTPEELWPLVADTNRFDRDTGIPPLTIVDEGERLPNARVRVSLFQYGVPLAYEQEPFEWQYPHHFSVTRNFTRGPLSQLRIGLSLTAQPGGRTRLHYDVWTTPRNLLGLLGIPFQVGWLLQRRFRNIFARYERAAARGERLLNTRETAGFAPGGERRLAGIEADLVRRGADAERVRKLVGMLSAADELVLSRMRPYEFADYWKADRVETLDLFLSATRMGLLKFRWDVLCPRCRVAKQSTTHLNELIGTTHCDTCNIDYETDFANSVELTFQPEDSIRPVSRREFCIGGPMSTPHVLAQFLLQPGESREIPVALAAGRYRLRTQDLPDRVSLAIDPAGASGGRIELSPSGFRADETSIRPDQMITVANSHPEPQLFLLERLAWADTAATAVDVFSRQKFHDLFSEEALRPGEMISVGRVVIVFTDLRHSTRLYRNLGDAPAFGYVMNHFDRIRRVFNDHGGVVLKTLGDAVMAIFPRPLPALQASFLAQAAIDAMEAGGEHLHLKVGVHYGMAITVTQNDRMDYFGSTVNVASRLDRHSFGSDIITTGDVVEDPEVRDWLIRSGIRAYPIDIRSRDIDPQRIKLWRLMTESNS